MSRNKKERFSHNSFLKEKYENFSKFFLANKKDFILFVGSGFSVNAYLPLWKSYIKRLYSFVINDVRIPGSVKNEIEKLATFADDNLSMATDVLISFLQEQLKNFYNEEKEDITSVLSDLQNNKYEKEIFHTYKENHQDERWGTSTFFDFLKYELKKIFPTVITTNFDRLFEERGEYKRLSYEKVNLNEEGVLHLHGVVEKEANNENIIRTYSQSFLQEATNEYKNIRNEIAKKHILCLGMNIDERSNFRWIANLEEKYNDFDRQISCLYSVVEKSEYYSDQYLYSLTKAYEKINITLITIKEYSEIKEFLIYLLEDSEEKNNSYKNSNNEGQSKINWDDNNNLYEDLRRLRISELRKITQYEVSQKAWNKLWNQNTLDEIIECVSSNQQIILDFFIKNMSLFPTQEEKIADKIYHFFRHFNYIPFFNNLKLIENKRLLLFLRETILENSTFFLSENISSDKLTTCWFEALEKYGDLSFELRVYDDFIKNNEFYLKNKMAFNKVFKSITNQTSELVLKNKIYDYLFELHPLYEMTVFSFLINISKKWRVTDNENDIITSNVALYLEIVEGKFKTINKNILFLIRRYAGSLSKMDKFKEQLKLLITKDKFESNILTTENIWALTSIDFLTKTDFFETKYLEIQKTSNLKKEKESIQDLQKHFEKQGLKNSVTIESIKIEFQYENTKIDAEEIKLLPYNKLDNVSVISNSFINNNEKFEPYEIWYFENWDRMDQKLKEIALKKHAINILQCFNQSAGNRMNWYEVLVFLRENSENIGNKENISMYAVFDILANSEYKSKNASDIFFFFLSFFELNEKFNDAFVDRQVITTSILINVIQKAVKNIFAAEDIKKNSKTWIENKDRLFLIIPCVNLYSDLLWTYEKKLQETRKLAWFYFCGGLGVYTKEFFLAIWSDILQELVTERGDEQDLQNVGIKELILFGLQNQYIDIACFNIFFEKKTSLARAIWEKSFKFELPKSEKKINIVREGISKFSDVDYFQYLKYQKNVSFSDGYEKTKLILESSKEKCITWKIFNSLLGQWYAYTNRPILFKKYSDLLVDYFLNKSLFRDFISKILHLILVVKKKLYIQEDDNLQKGLDELEKLYKDAMGDIPWFYELSREKIIFYADFLNSKELNNKSDDKVKRELQNAHWVIREAAYFLSKNIVD